MATALVDSMSGSRVRVTSGENTQLKRSPFKAWSRSVYSHTFYAYCQRFLPCLFLPFQSIHMHFFQNLSRFPLQWGAAGAEIKVPSGENTGLKRSPFKACSRSLYSQICSAYCQGFVPCLFLPLRSIHLHLFFKTSPDFSCVGCG